MPAKSQAQQKFFAIVKNYQQGKMKNASPAVKKLANSMNKKDVDDFANTKRKGLPIKVRQEVIEILQEFIK